MTYLTTIPTEFQTTLALNIFKGRVCSVNDEWTVSSETLNKLSTVGLNELFDGASDIGLLQLDISLDERFDGRFEVWGVALLMGTDEIDILPVDIECSV